jgi:hypothetical protein
VPGDWSRSGDRGPDFEKLRESKLPENPTDEQIRSYIDEIVVASRDQNVFSESDPQMEMLTKVGPERLSFLLDAAREQGIEGYYLTWAIVRLAAKEHKKLILDMLPFNQELVKAVVKLGWEKDARHILLDQLSLKRKYLPPEWIEAVVRLRDPKTYDDLKAYFIDGPHRCWTYKSIQQLPDIDLEQAVGEAWKVAKGGNEWEAANMAMIAMAHGHLDALEYLVGVLASSGRKDRYQNMEFRSAVLRRIPFEGSDKEIAQWFRQNKNGLSFDTKQKKFVVGAQREAEQAKPPVP